MDKIIFPERVWNRERTESGTPTQTTRRCQMEGCRWPCLRGLDTAFPSDWKIL